MSGNDSSRSAFALMRRRDFGGAVAMFDRLLDNVHDGRESYEPLLAGLAEALQGLGRVRSAAYVLHFLGESEEALGLVREDHPLDAARLLEQGGAPARAGRHYLEGGKLCLAAIAFERAGADARARECWQRAATTLPAERSTYERALLHFNLGYCCLRLGETAGHGSLVTAQRLLEEAADEFETAGLRERAFDCYQILLEMGRRSGVFENLAEGYLNCIRVLQEDGLKFYVLQFYEDFLARALQAEEFHAAATLYQEVAHYCQRTGMPYDEHYVVAAAETWLRAADQQRRDDGALELCENALLAAVGCYNTVGDYHGVGEAYRRLARLELPRRRRERYTTIAARYEGAQLRTARPVDLPDYLRQTQAYPEIWIHDLVEMELDGDPVATCATVLGDAAQPNLVRRRALHCLIWALGPEETGALEQGRAPAFLAEVARRLGALRIYAALRPLERLMEWDEPQVQAGVMAALSVLFFKRAFVPLRRGLASPHPEVRGQALATLGQLYFKHAFDPLLRIFREFSDEEVRATALASVARIPTLEAGDFLLQVLRHEDEDLRSQARERLVSFQCREFAPVLEQHLRLESDPRMRSELDWIINARQLEPTVTFR